MIDYDKITGIERNRVKDICFQLEQSHMGINSMYKCYFATKPDIRTAAVIVAIQDMTERLDRVIEILNSMNMKEV